ncbi:MAG: hypothetical protein HKN82_05910 [Akkermansiaceae bacterium]|nr:hypothetical protein [Akkermansiaceae bacterium]NNM30566.1 hypothetical protein [Akkermansiaceae bacterium]
MKGFGLLLLAVTAPFALAEPGAGGAAAVPEKPAIRDLGDGRMQVGTVTLKQADRTISFPAEVNMTEGLLEYAIVHQNGKIHESLFHTTTDPFDLNVALKLLRYQPSEELFEIFDDEEGLTGKFPEVSEETRNAARVEILISWKCEDDKKKEASLNDLITYAVTSKPLPAIPWVYGGSYVANGAFQARSTGDIVAIFTSQPALFNYPGKDRELDDVWIPTPKRVPPVGTPVTITIKPFAPERPSK